MTDPTNSRFRYLNLKGDATYRRYISEGQNTGLQNQGDIKASTETPAHGSYGALLFRPEWRARREEILARDRACVVCKEGNDLQVHHRQYRFVVRDSNFKMPWDYEDRLLV